MKSDWARVKAYIEATNVGTTFSKFTAEDLSEFADALDTVFKDVVFVLVSRRIHAIEDDDVTPGAQGA